MEKNLLTKTVQIHEKPLAPSKLFIASKVEETLPNDPTTKSEKNMISIIEEPYIPGSIMDISDAVPIENKEISIKTIKTVEKKEVIIEEPVINSIN